MLPKSLCLGFPLVVLFFLTVLASNANAVPMADKAPCDENVQPCETTLGDKVKTITPVAPVDGGQSLPQDVFELLGAQFVHADIVKLLDQRTAAILNTAVYPMKRGKDLLESYILNVYSGNVSGSGGMKYGPSNDWRSHAFSDAHEFGSSRNRNWADVASGYERRNSSSDAPKRGDGQEKMSWIAKSASALEYAGVLVVCLVFWMWFRQSKSF